MAKLMSSRVGGFSVSRYARAFLSLVKHCLSHYPQVLSGQEDGLGVLFPGGDVGFFDKALSKDGAQYTEMPIVNELVSSYLAALSQSRPLTILEVGGGNGLFTKKLLKKAKLSNVAYHFTDISRRFTLNMDRYVQEIPDINLKSTRFDITKPAESQGLGDGYDFIVALDVVHATKDIGQSLENLKPLLKENSGLLLMLETTCAPLWQHLIMGLTAGWWCFDDKYRDATPLASEVIWQTVAADCGYKCIGALTLDNKHSDAMAMLLSR
ncbi:MAG: hypothetical protein COV52_01265 [Gammaproteobacteria bacterium CG11_big_fil_rev_8_21_14_0_20_46_22]|nr:MAG: hypothetical protein COW05_02445 [Gammaproteobacteria bacterium CG12_big_fil_rev_8_21_14_0_65_46_12]PIR11957.1 MAG: hypothetical protein COV52_01265 [Gammaproteobacteria bacterium CG11_big_fil_rev_8_21_14_0_20_46_22]